MVRVIFVHPDLGIGGAERAVIDAALALRSCGHAVMFITAHHDRSHCFEETQNGTLQISACIPVLLWSRRKVLFYCHYPDLLLTTRDTALKSFYRTPIDWLEEYTTGKADCILVNSRFTAGVFMKTFSSLNHLNPEVVYPTPDFLAFEDAKLKSSDCFDANSEKLIFLSINRYERKKNLALALRAFSILRKQLKVGHLLIAGGYDKRVQENVDHYNELHTLSAQLELSDHVTFYRSIGNEEKISLLNICSCLLYTPDQEHFGIVPLEAMHMVRPVIAVASGGPLETVVDGVTGFLCPADEHEFADAMMKFARNPTLVKEMGEAGKRRMSECFSFCQFAERLNTIVKRLTDKN